MDSNNEWVLDNIDRDVNLNASLALAIANNQVQVVSNGSYYRESAAGGAGWYIESLDRELTTSSNSMSPGAPTAQSSSWSELHGILCSIMHVNYICNRFDIQQGHVQLYCDNEGAINSLQQQHSYIKNSWNNFDMFQSIHRAIQYSPVQWQFNHIEGHLNELHDFESLSRPHQLNVMADLKAKEIVINAIEENTTHQYHLQSLPYSSCDIFLVDENNKQSLIHSHLQKAIKHHCSSTQIKQYWLKKYQLEHSSNMIDWDLKRTSHNNVTKSKNRWLSKHATGFCGVDSKLVKYNYQTHSTCPWCGQPSESTSHVLQCTNTSACALWDKEIANLQEWMKKNKFQPNLADVICNNLDTWKYKTPKSPTLPVNQSLRIALLQQDRLGWKPFLIGFLSKHWRECQQQHLNNINSCTSALLLLSKAQRRIWHIAWELWMHQNNHLHGEQSSTPIVEQTAIDDEVTREWTLGLLTLAEQHWHLFQGSLATKLSKSYHSKRVWLSTVWAAREIVEVNYLDNNPSQYDSTIRLRYEQWKQRHKKYYNQLQEEQNNI